jgi:hypothetical protein
MRRARHIVVLTALVLAGSAPAVAAEHPTDHFDACLTRADVGFCDDIFSYLYGDTVILKGTISPTHDEAVVLRKEPGSDRWERADTVEITAAGRMKWRWRTHRGDAVQDEPYLLRFKVPGHGKSDVVHAYVLFGE